MNPEPAEEEGTYSFFADAIQVPRRLVAEYGDGLDEIEFGIAMTLLFETLGEDRVAAPCPTKRLARYWGAVKRTVSESEIHRALTRMVERGVLLAASEASCPDTDGAQAYIVNPNWPAPLGEN